VAPPGNSTRSLGVLIVHDSLSENGGVRLTLDLAGRLVAAGAKAEVFALQPVREGREAVRPQDVRLTRGVGEGARLRSSGAAAFARLLGACRRADVVVSGSEVGLGLLAARAASRIARRPFVVLIHAPLGRAIELWVPSALQVLTRRAHRTADAAICVGTSLVDEVIGNGLDSRSVHVVPNAVDAEKVRRLAGAPAAATGGKPVLVGLGRLSAEKGFDLLIRAHARVLESGPVHELELIGEGPERQPLLALASELGVQGSVSLPGFLENPFPRLARAAALVLPSHHEGGPLSLLEALALSVPVIGARSALAGADLLPDDVVERVADGSLPELASAIQRHLEHPERLRAAARAGAEAVREHSLEHAAEDYLRILGATARRRRADTTTETAFE
jgi:glycosyltransferase involved in cell wall biosynthesis